MSTSTILLIRFRGRGGRKLKAKSKLENYYFTNQYPGNTLKLTETHDSYQTFISKKLECYNPFISYSGRNRYQ